VVFFVCIIMFKLATLTDLRELQEHMSVEQREDFKVPSSVLSFVLLATVVGTLVLSGLILLVMLSREKQRHRAEVRAARARRLRYLRDGKHGRTGEEVTLDKLLNSSEKQELLKKLHPRTPKSDLGLIPHAGPFHVFLSHNWLHGQNVMCIVKTRLRELLPDIEVRRPLCIHLLVSAHAVHVPL
jgi:hypothetical protein